MDNTFYINTVIELINTINNKTVKENVLIETKQLLNKMLRSYSPTLKKTLISEAALKLYNELTTEKISKQKLTGSFKANNISSNVKKLFIKIC